jgi:LysR family transcriptional regulator, glycine cleavage system transcriptional activator
MSDLPPLSAIRAFEAAARHESFTKAAAELGMTQAAVSYQVKLLEDRLGAPLFLRLPRKVVLSETGKRLAPSVGEAFQRLRAAFAALRETAEGVLSITAINTFATNWLVPRLGAFQVAHPNIAVKIDTAPRTVDFTREEFDIGLRTGRGEWPGLKAHMLMPVEFTPMCSPEFLARAPKLTTPADLLNLPLLDWRDEWWRQWFALAGIPDPKPLRPPPVEIDSQLVLGQAALTGQGVALLTPAFFAPEIAAGRLIQPFDLVARAESSYWIVYPEERQSSPKIRAFRDWILGEVRHCVEQPKAALKLVR